MAEGDRGGASGLKFRIEELPAPKTPSSARNGDWLLLLQPIPKPKKSLRRNTDFSGPRLNPYCKPQAPQSSVKNLKTCPERRARPKPRSPAVKLSKLAPQKCETPRSPGPDHAKQTRETTTTRSPDPHKSSQTRCNPKRTDAGLAGPRCWDALDPNCPFSCMIFRIVYHFMQNSMNLPVHRRELHSLAQHPYCLPPGFLGLETCI